MTESKFDSKDLRRALGGFATGVTIVTTTDQDARNWGFTANSFTSVSLDPPLVLACIAKSAYSCSVYSAASAFAVNILSEQQKDLAGVFSQPIEDRFKGVAWRREETGCPILEDVVCWFDCTMHETVEAGDHIILIGKIVRYRHTDRTPLGYCQGAYVSFGVAEELLQSSGSHSNLRVGIIAERDEQILFYSEDEFESFALPTASSIGDKSDESSLIGRLHKLGIVSRLPYVFAVYGAADAQNVYYRDEISDSTDTSLPTAKDLEGIADCHRWIAFDDIQWERIDDPAVRTMLTRYVNERRNNAFGIYVGDAVQGEVHVPDQA